MVSLTSVAVVESAAGEATSTAGSPGGSITRTNYQLAASDRTNRYLAFDEQEVAPAAMSRLSDAERARPVEISRRWRTSLAQLAASIGLLESNEQWPSAPLSFLITLSAIAESQRDRQVATGFEGLYFLEQVFSVFRIVRGRCTVQSP